jgi:glycosyltransferase involved in cell wall biosynthesis
MEKKIKILYFIDGLYPGGKERQFIEILKLLDRQTYTIGIVTFNKNLFYSETAKKLSDYFVEIDKFNRFNPFLSVWKPIKEFKPDIIHTWDYLSSTYIFLPSRIKRIKFIDNSIQDVGVEKGWKRKLKLLMLNWSDLALSNSQTGLKNYKVKGEYIYNAINQERFLQNEENKEFNIIKVASFSDYKDYQTVIDAGIELVKNNVVDNFYFAGDGPHRIKHQEYVKNNFPEVSAKFHFLGAINNVEYYLSKCKVGVLCSTVKYGEGISNSVLEYMAAGLVPIVTDIGGSCEIVSNEENGFLIPPASTNKIIEKVIFIKNNPEISKKMVEKAKQTVSTKFNYISNIEKLSNIYKKMINRH